MKVVYHTTPSENLLHLASLSKCLGIEAEHLDVQKHDSLVSALQGATVAGNDGVVLDVATLQEKCRPEELDAVAALFSDRRIAVLLLATTADQTRNWLLEGLTGGAVRKSESAGAATGVAFPKEGYKLSGVLSSYAYSRKQSPAMALDVCAANGVEVVMKLDQAPSFVRVQRGGANLFVWSTARVFDVLKPLSAEKEFEDSVEEYVPAIIFLRFAFGERCWHNPVPGAGIVIDDPLLQKQYGFINFPRLLESARRHKYHVTLAFIPWNYWRSRTARARMFLDYQDCFSVCTHGCDHTNREFNSADYEDLLTRNLVASQRMERHRQRTGITHVPLMVCPQEEYSLEAMRAFADSRQFIGLTCTACMPRNLASPKIRGADLLLPAQDSFFGFPVFKRHYWSGLSVFALALFLGKPAILVEHHEFFRDGPGGAEAFASGLATLRPGLNWTSLAETAMRTHLRRKLAEGRHEVRFFTDRFELEHSSTGRAEYHFTRRIPAITPVRRVTVNGAETPFLQENETLTFSAEADRPRNIQVRMEVATTKPTKAYGSGMKYQASVALRRGLSEFRDNVIARNRFALRAGKLLARALKQTSG